MRFLSFPVSNLPVSRLQRAALMCAHLAGGGIFPMANAMAHEPVSGNTRPVSAEEQIGRAGEKLTRILEGIGESVQAQEVIVKRRRARMLQLMQEHTILDPYAFPHVPAHGRCIGDVPLPSSATKLRKLRVIAATMFSVERGLSQCSGGRLHEAIRALGLDATVAALSLRHGMATTRLEQMTEAGLGANHPEKRALAATIRQMESLLAAAEKNYQESAALETTCLRVVLTKAERDDAEGKTAEISPEVWKHYTEERTQWEIASALLEKFRASARELTTLALDSYERDVEGIIE